MFSIFSNVKKYTTIQVFFYYYLILFCYHNAQQTTISFTCHKYFKMLERVKIQRLVFFINKHLLST